MNLAYHCLPPSFPTVQQSAKRLWQAPPHTNRHPMLYLSYSPSLSRCIKATLMTLEASRRTQGIVITKWQAHTHTQKIPFLCVPSFSFTIITDTARLDLFKRAPLYHTHQLRPHAVPRSRCRFWMSGKFTRNLLNFAAVLYLAVV